MEKDGINSFGAYLELIRIEIPLYIKSLIL